MEELAAKDLSKGRELMMMMLGSFGFDFLMLFRAFILSLILFGRSKW